jgi:hypothetical protein
MISGTTPGRNKAKDAFEVRTRRRSVNDGNRDVVKLLIFGFCKRNAGTPRGPRLGGRRGLYHVIARKMERRAIFRDDTDRESFLRRLAAGRTRGERQSQIPFSCAESDT